MGVTSSEFVTLVRKSRLVEESLLADWLRTQGDGAGGLPDDPELLARRLVQAELVTAWQARKLLAGKYRGFYLGRYKLLDHIGTGGMSRVYLAEHMLLHQRRAVKILSLDRLQRPGQWERFQIEAQALAALDHPHIVRVYDVDRQGDVCYLVVEFVPGQDLQRLVSQSGCLDVRLAVRYVVQAAETLHYAHRHGFIHRDVKPANLMVDQHGQIKVLDFGLARIVGSEAVQQLDAQDRVVGTADYMAPEQSVDSSVADPRTDIYGLGGTFYFLLTGRPPFATGSPAQRIAAHRRQRPVPVRALRPDCPESVERMCLRMLEKLPEHRYQSAADVAAVLRAWLSQTVFFPVKDSRRGAEVFQVSSKPRHNLGVARTKEGYRIARHSRRTALAPDAQRDTVAGWAADTVSGVPCQEPKAAGGWGRTWAWVGLVGVMILTALVSIPWAVTALNSLAAVVVSGP
jgi:serine/threonine protein kinase